MLHREVTDLGVRIDLPYAEPAHEFTPELPELYVNRCTVVRQLGHSCGSNRAGASTPGPS